MTEGKPNLIKLTEDKPKFAQITGGEICHECPKPNKFQITKTKTQKKYLQIKIKK